MKAPDPEYVRRPLANVAALAKRFPAGWREIDHAREERKNSWPSGCFLPLNCAYEILRDKYGPPEHIDVAAFGALGTWRITQGIYRFDQTLLDELWRTPITGAIPSDLLERLPEWCCYVPVDPPRRFLRIPIRGFFVHLDWDATKKDLRFLLDFDDHPDLSYRESRGAPGIRLGLVELAIVKGTLEDCIAATIKSARSRIEKTGVTYGSVEQANEMLTLFENSALDSYAPLVSLALYLCSASPDIIGTRRDIVQTRTRRNGCVTMAPIYPQTWEVGFKIGATLRKARTLEASTEDRGGSHASPKPHIRRAHWHAFWTGAKDLRRLVLKWLHPILVAAGDGDIIPTVYPVKH